MAECLKTFAEEEDIQRAFYPIEYSQFKYNKEFHGSEMERAMDKLRPTNTGIIGAIHHKGYSGK